MMVIVRYDEYGIVRAVYRVFYESGAATGYDGGDVINIFQGECGVRGAPVLLGSDP